MRRSHTIAIAAAALVVGSLAIATLNPLGLAGAQDDQPPTTSDAAPEPPPPGHPGPGGGVLGEALDSLVEDGTLTADQAQSVRDRMRERARERAGALRGNGRPWFHGHRGANRGARPLHAAAEVIGVEPGELMAALRDGSTVADVAGAHGVATDTLVSELVARATGHIDRAVADGRLDAERAEQLKAGLGDRITERVSTPPPPRPRLRAPDGAPPGPGSEPPVPGD